MHSTSKLIKRNSIQMKNTFENENIEHLKELINKNCAELIILQNIKKMMKLGEIQIEGLSSKQRQFLHELADKYNMEHYSIGNYNNRIIVLKNKLHTHFINNNDKLDLNNIILNKMEVLKNKKDEENEKKEEDDEEEEEQEEDEEEEEEDEEYNEDTDTYDSEDDSDDEEQKVHVSKFDNFSVGEKCIYMLSIFNILISSYTLVTVSKFAY